MKIAGKLMQIFAADGTKAAEALVELSFSEEFKNHSGEFLKYTRRINYSAYFNERNLQEKLWNISKSMIIT